MLGCTPECSTPVQDERACVSCCVSQSESSFGTGVRSGISNSDTYGHVTPLLSTRQHACQPQYKHTVTVLFYVI